MLRKIMLSCAGIIMLISCSRHQYRNEEGMVWNTTYHISYESTEDLADSIRMIFNEVSKSLNVFDKSSLVSRANAADTITVDDHFIKVHEMSQRISRLSGGAFDPTLGPLIDAWGFGKGHIATADTLRLDSLLAITGINKTHITDRILYKADPRISFNFSAIAKGYGCDMVAEMLERNGVRNYLVEIGGEIRCNGESPSGRKWRISIDRPVRTDTINHDSQCVVELASGGLATSGNYRNYNEHTAPGTGHTISSETGRPVETDILSASVVAPTAMEADALATAMMAMGYKKARTLAERLGYPVLLVLNDLSVWQQTILSEGAEP